MESEAVRDYRSNYRFICEECGQPIQPQTPYFISRRYENFRGQRITAFDRVHVKCPEGANAQG
jgi:hypothetical protein